MNSLSDRNQMLRVIEGIEAGTLSASDAYNVLKDRDPVLVYFTIRYLKDKFGGSQPQSLPVQQRLVELTSTYDDLRSMFKKGESDILRQWFDDSHTVREFSREPETFVDLIIEKFEG